MIDRISSRHKLIINNQKLVYHCAKRYRALSCFEDVVQEGMVGLVKAAKNYDDSKPNKNFVSYASTYIRGEIKHFFRDKLAMIRTTRGCDEIPMASLNCVNPANGKEYVDSIECPNTIENAEHDPWVAIFSRQLKPDDVVVLQMTLDGATLSAIQVETGLNKKEIGQRRRRIAIAVRKYFNLL